MTTAADTQIATTFTAALQAALGDKAEAHGSVASSLAAQYGTAATAAATAAAATAATSTAATSTAATSTAQRQRLLIVNDITCGALPYACASLGYAVDVVNDDDALTVAGQEACALQKLHASTIVVPAAASATEHGAATAAAVVASSDVAAMDAEGGKAAERRETQEGSRRGRRAPLSTLDDGNTGICSGGAGCSLCPRSHPLSLESPAPTPFDEHFALRCDVCDGTIEPTAPRYACVTCDYDVCSRCASSSAGDASMWPRGSCRFFTGRVDTEPANSRKTRALFVPDDDNRSVYSAVLFPSALLDAFRTDEPSARRAQHAGAICDRWLLPGGIRLPANPVRLEEDVLLLSRRSLYRSCLPLPSLRLAGVEGALIAFGVPCAATDGVVASDEEADQQAGASAAAGNSQLAAGDAVPVATGELFDTSDVGLAFHGFHAVDLYARPSSLAGKKRREGDEADGTAASGASGDAAAGGASADVSADDDAGIAAGVLGARVELLKASPSSSSSARPSSAASASSSTTVPSVSGTTLRWSLPTFQQMARSQDNADVRSAVARCMYQGVRVRLARDARAPTNVKKAKTDSD